MTEQPSAPTLELGSSKQRKLYFLELSSYPVSGQPRLTLRPYLHVGHAVVLTYEVPSLDLRAYDADWGFRRRHAILRVSGEFSKVYDYLIETLICAPADKTLISDGSVYGRVCRLDLARCVIGPQEETATDVE